MSSNLKVPHILTEQQRFLPINNVSKMMKSTVPPKGKVGKEAKQCMQECASEFISFVTSEAAEHCSRQKRKTINGEDIIMSLHSLGFDNYIEPMQKYLIQHRENKAMFSQTQGNACKDDSSDSSMQISKPGELPLSLIPGHWD